MIDLSGITPKPLVSSMSSKRIALGFLGLSPTPVAGIAKGLAADGVDRLILLTTEDGLSEYRVQTLEDWVTTNTTISTVETHRISSGVKVNPFSMASDIALHIAEGVTDVFFGPGTMEMNALLAIASRSDNSPELTQWYRLDSGGNVNKSQGSNILDINNPESHLETTLSLEEVLSINGLAAKELSNGKCRIHSLKEPQESLPFDCNGILLGREERLVIFWEYNKKDKKARNFENRVLEQLPRIESQISDHSYQLKVSVLNRLRGTFQGRSLEARFQQYGITVSWNL
jgi:hypothetical protein